MSLVPEGARILPYSQVVGQSQLKTALELSFICPEIGGVLISGERGTAKSTSARSFALMMYGELPVTLPINATDDRVVGGWQLDRLLRGQAVEQPGLLERAAKSGFLYIDEVNLLDDHIVNILLDVTSTGVLAVQREGLDRVVELEFNLVGTMNPDEGELRPQLLDRFGLMVEVAPESDPAVRLQILETLLRSDGAFNGHDSEFLEQAHRDDQRIRAHLESARAALPDVVLGDAARVCASLSARLGISSHRGDHATLLAARALAAHRGDEVTTIGHVVDVAPMTLRHRRNEVGRRGVGHWSLEDQAELQLAIDELTG